MPESILGCAYLVCIFLVVCARKTLLRKGNDDDSNIATNTSLSRGDRVDAGQTRTYCRRVVYITERYRAGRTAAPAAYSAKNPRGITAHRRSDCRYRPR
jgi:hypothetical protein